LKLSVIEHLIGIICDYLAISDVSQPFLSHRGVTSSLVIKATAHSRPLSRFPETRHLVRTSGRVEVDADKLSTLISFRHGVIRHPTPNTFCLGRRNCRAASIQSAGVHRDAQKNYGCCPKAPPDDGAGNLFGAAHRSTRRTKSACDIQVERIRSSGTSGKDRTDPYQDTLDGVLFPVHAGQQLAVRFRKAR